MVPHRTQACRRTAMAHAFIAKAVWNLPGTKDIIYQFSDNAAPRRLCGWAFPWEVPSESTFSRAFAQFAQMELPRQISCKIILRQVDSWKVHL